MTQASSEFDKFDAIYDAVKTTTGLFNQGGASEYLPLAESHPEEKDNG